MDEFPSKRPDQSEPGAGGRDGRDGQAGGRDGSDGSDDQDVRAIERHNRSRELAARAVERIEAAIDRGRFHEVTRLKTMPGGLVAAWLIEPTESSGGIKISIRRRPLRLTATVPLMLLTTDLDPEEHSNLLFNAMACNAELNGASIGITEPHPDSSEELLGIVVLRVEGRGPVCGGSLRELMHRTRRLAAQLIASDFTAVAPEVPLGTRGGDDEHSGDDGDHGRGDRGDDGRGSDGHRRDDRGRRIGGDYPGRSRYSSRGESRGSLGDGDASIPGVDLSAMEENLIYSITQTRSGRSMIIMPESVALNAIAKSRHVDLDLSMQWLPTSVKILATKATRGKRQLRFSARSEKKVVAALEQHGFRVRRDDSVFRKAVRGVTEASAELAKEIRGMLGESG